jgi:HAD superfamily hydrolase (TIGR01450 family)
MDKTDVHAVIFDLDGVIFRGGELIEGADKIIRKLEDAQIRTAFMTNNAGFSRRMLREKLESVGIDATVEQMMSSAYAAAQYAKNMEKKPKRAYIIGEYGLIEELENAGIEVVSDEDYEKADLLICGIDRKLDYKKLDCALNLLYLGKYWIACNLDKSWPAENSFRPGSGMNIAALAYGAGKTRHGQNLEDDCTLHAIELREPDMVVGKPSSYMLELMMREDWFEHEPKKCMFVGDRLYTDIRLANKTGMISTLVLTGETLREEAESARGDLKQDYIIDSIRNLDDIIRL